MRKVIFLLYKNTDALIYPYKYVCMHLIYTMYANIFINKSTEVYYLSILIHPVCTATEFNLEQNKSKKLQHKGITLSNPQQANKADIFK